MSKKDTSGPAMSNRAFLRKSVRDTMVAWGYILPALLLFVVFMFWPVAYTFIMSFFKGSTADPTKAFVGFSNYKTMLQDPATWQLLKQTGLYVLILIVVNFLVPYIMAFINHFVMQRFKKFYKVIIFMPSLISLVVGAMLIQWMFNPIIGPVSKLLVLFGGTMPHLVQNAGPGDLCHQPGGLAIRPSDTISWCALRREQRLQRAHRGRRGWKRHPTSRSLPRSSCPSPPPPPSTCSS